VREPRARMRHCSTRRVKMDVSELGTLLAIGALAGLLAGTLMRDGGLGLIGNVVIGVIGAFIGNWMFTLFRIGNAGGIVSPIGSAFIGAIVLLFFINLIKKA